MQPIGLYYPYVHFRDRTWIKAAALYWPQMARVVPREFPVSDPDFVKALSSELGFVVDVDPGEATAAVAREFVSVIDNHHDDLRRRLGRRARQALWHRNTDFGDLRTGDHIVNSEPIAPGDRPARHVEGRPLAGLYWNEVDPRLRDVLLGSGLAIQAYRNSVSGHAPGPWLAVDAELAWVYKCALTEELGRRSAYAPTTDQIMAHSATDGWDSDRMADVLLGRAPRVTQPDPTARLGLMAVRYVVPERLGSVPVEKIIKLRRAHRSEFDAFRHGVEQTAADLRELTAGIESRAAFERHLELTFEERLAAPLEELRKAMNGLSLKTIETAVSTKYELPTAAALAVGSGWIGQTPGTVIGGALALATIRRTAAQERDEQLQNSPVSYLLRVERNLKPTTLVRRITRSIARVAGTGI